MSVKLVIGTSLFFKLVISESWDPLKCWILEAETSQKKKKSKISSVIFLNHLYLKCLYYVNYFLKNQKLQI